MVRLLNVEKELKVKLKEREQRMAELQAQLQRLEDSVELTQDVYNAAYHQAINSAQTGQGAGGRERMMERRVRAGGVATPASDYLTPFLLPFAPNISLTRKQAEQVKTACLTALKERLLSRASIIQAHLEDEQGKLQSRQSQFKRQAGSGSMDANEEFQAFSEGCLFRIDILLARRARHEQMAVRKYADMEQQLNRDTRLAALRSTE